MAPPPINADWLGSREKIGAGGQGTVYRLLTYQLEPPDPTIYKEYDETVARSLDAAVLNKAIVFAEQLNEQSRTWLLGHAAWPAATVVRGGAVIGFLMRSVPDEFYIDLALSERHEHRPAGVEYLLNAQSYLDRMGLTITDRSRIELLVDLAKTLGVLHTAGVVVGDVSPRNLLFDLRVAARCFLLDCDAMYLAGASALPYAETPNWGAPEYREGTSPTWHSDVYKFALLAVRLAGGEQTGSDVTALARYSPRLKELAERSLAEEPTLRPRIADWLEELERFLPFASETRQTPEPPHQSPQPRPAKTAKPGSAPRTRRPAPHTVVAAGLVALVLFLGTALLGRCTGRAASGPPDIAGTRIGVVDTREVSADEQALAVAALFDTYFTALNEGRAESAIQLFDPANRLNPTNPRRREGFIAAAQASEYRDVRLLDVDADGDTVAQADVTFTTVPRSGSSGRCIRWRVIYRLTTEDGRTYRILHGRESRSSC